MNLFYYQLFLGGPYPLLQMTITVCDRKQYKSAQVARCYKWIEADGHMSHAQTYPPKKFVRNYILPYIHRTNKISFQNCSSECPLLLVEYVSAGVIPIRACMRKLFLYIYFWAENHCHIATLSS